MISLSEPLNYANGSVVFHPIILLDGKVTDRRLEFVQIRNITTGNGLCWPVVSGRFRVFVLLRPGANLISIKHGFCTKELTYTLRLRQSPYIVHPLYVISKNSNGNFQAPEYSECSPSAACRRIGLGAGLLQAFTAVNMKSLNLTSSTFQLPLDSTSGLPVCTIFKSKYSNEEMYAMTDKELWRSIAREIMECKDFPNRYTSKFLAFISCTKYDGGNWTQHWRHRDTVASTKGHIALGGGGLAVLGTGTLHTWAESLESLVTCFTDEDVIDCSKLMDDSAYRGTYWANYATGLGAALHELGHTFDLSHTHTGIMSRGFDNIHKFFVLDGARPVKQLMSSKHSNVGSLETQPDVKFSPEPIRRFCSIVPIHTFVCVPSNSSVTSRRQSTTANHRRTATQSVIKISSLVPSIQPADDDSGGHMLGDVTQRTPDIGSDTYGGGRCEEMTDCTSAWSLESATMLRYSRWCMCDGEIGGNSVGFKPAITGRCVEASLGIRVIQIYHRCLDRIMYSRHHPPEEAMLTTADLPEIMSAQRESHLMTHVSGCDGGTACVSVHVRDSRGNFLSESVTLL